MGIHRKSHELATRIGIKFINITKFVNKKATYFFLLLVIGSLKLYIIAVEWKPAEI